MNSKGDIFVTLENDDSNYLVEVTTRHAFTFHIN